MGKHIRHIWAKANQHIKVHRTGARSRSRTNDDNGAIVYIAIGIIIFIWLIK